MSELVRSEPAANSGSRSSLVQLPADASGRARSTARRAAYDAEEPSDGKAGPKLHPGLEMCPPPAVHSDLATLVALAVPDDQRATVRVKVGLVESEGLADA